MCGIFCVYYKNDRRSLANANLRESAVASSLHSRGPDESNIFHISESITLIHTRLSINGLDNGKQPFQHTKTIFSVVNGEIYNYKNLATSTDVKKFLKTDSDCEVLGTIYANQKSILEECDGMYAYAVIDTDTNKIISGRDENGEKPLYCFEDKNFYIVSSTQLAILLFTQNQKFSILPILEYCRYQFNHEYTFVDGCRMLKPGEEIIYDISDKKKFSRYPKNRELVSTIDSFDQLWELLCTSVDRVLLSEVELSLALSSGLDSTLIAAISSKVCGKKLKCVTFDNGQSDSELYLARQTSSILKLDHCVVNCLEQDIYNYLLEYPLYDRPIGDLAQIGYYSICKKLQLMNRKVLLLGHGLDEAYFGYSWLNSYGKQTFRINNLLFNPRGQNPFSASVYASQSFAEYRSLFGHIWDLSVAAEDTLNHNLTPMLAAYGPCRSMYLVENGLMQTDNIGMSLGIEARSPFAAKNVVKASLSSDFRKFSKYQLLSRLFQIRPELSDVCHVLNRKKLGFSPGGQRLNIIVTHHFDKTFIESKNSWLQRCNIIDTNMNLRNLSFRTKRVLLFMELFLNNLYSISYA